VVSQVGAEVNAQSGDPIAGPFRLEKLFFHTGACMGSCPAVDLFVDSNLTIYLRRQLYMGKGRVDSVLSGAFAGKLDPHTYFDLYAALSKSHYRDLVFRPAFCFDGSVVTIIVYADGGRVKLSSMWPPKEATALIDFLRNLALRVKLPRADGDWELEN
jgi:Domain of unknown function (DUF6438)